MRNLYEKIFDRSIIFFSQKNSRIYIYFISFIESIFFPIPTDIFLIPYVLAKKNEYLKIAINITAFSVLGGLFAYYIGFFIWNKISPLLTEIYPLFIFKLDQFNEQFYEVGIILIIIGGFSPFPYKITCLGSGIIGINIFQFIIFSLLSRFLRFFLVSYLVFKYGNATKNIVGKYINFISIILIIIFFLYMFKLI